MRSALVRIFRIGILVVSTYAVVWGAAWLSSPVDSVIFGRADGRGFSIYPDAVLGGLPPLPSDHPLPALVAIVAGALGLIAGAIPSVAAWLRRRRSDSHAAE